eukprot:GHVS01096056.1.p1 GENE.GHVS01096056.1~~GHVS01096056.1.p1  ORF type:complete len:123 (-),score=22.50 GHVS01096056.1:118-486(-)
MFLLCLLLLSLPLLPPLPFVISQFHNMDSVNTIRSPSSPVCSSSSVYQPLLKTKKPSIIRPVGPVGARSRQCCSSGSLSPPSIALFLSFSFIVPLLLQQRSYPHTLSSHNSNHSLSSSSLLG